MSLRTYDKLNSHYIRSYTSTTKASKLSPGALVACDFSEKTIGMLVAVDKKDLTVLWSIAPTREPLRYNPLDQMEDIFIPIGCQSGPNCPGCMGANCPGRPIKEVKQEVGWVKRQINRVFGKK